MRRPEVAMDLAAAFAAHRTYLWGLAYRLTGTTADADEVVQDTFLRALEHPPADLARDLKPWLVRVAVNLGRDRLRRRRRRPYDGPWLPALVDTPEPLATAPSGESRYSERESVSLAFLTALEALTPTQRAVVVLREVLELSVRETADALGASEEKVRTTHLRARRLLVHRGHEPGRRPSDERQVEAIAKLLGALAAGDAASLQALLTDDVRSVSDAGGEFHAARLVVEGRDRVTRLMLGLLKQAGAGYRSELRSINGEPAVLVEVPASGRFAPRIVLRVELATDGRIAEIQAILASGKLLGVRGSNP